MMHVVVKPFPYAGNGYTLENLNAGDKRDFGAFADGLLAAGLIAAEDAIHADEPPESAAIEMAVATDAPIETKPARRARK